MLGIVPQVLEVVKVSSEGAIVTTRHGKAEIAQGKQNAALFKQLQETKAFEDRNIQGNFRVTLMWPELS